ncbi:MAG TPA: hypothetical protein VGB17_10695, partial [Pyrinomonadaceae bacterium]
MTKQVVLLNDSSPALAEALTEALRQAGIALLVDRTPASRLDRAAGNGNGNHAPSEWETLLPLALVYEVAQGASLPEIHAAIELALEAWPGAQLVALRPQSSEQHSPYSHHLPDDATLLRLGFRAVAERPAQLPALLRELEERGMTGDLRLPADAAGFKARQIPRLPKRLANSVLRAAFELLARLQSVQDQQLAAQTALCGLASMVQAERWTIYLASETNGAEAARLEA